MKERLSHKWARRERPWLRGDWTTKVFALISLRTRLCSCELACIRSVAKRKRKKNMGNRRGCSGMERERWKEWDEERMCNGIIVVNHTHKGIYVHSHMIDRPWGERKWWRQIDDWQITFAMSVCSQMLLLLWWPTLETWHRAPAMKKKSKPHDHWSTHALQSYLIHDLLPTARRRFELKIENKNWIDHEFVEFVFMVS